MTPKMSNERREDGFKARFAVESGSNPAVALFAFMTACGILAVSHWLYVEISELSGMSLTLVSALDAIGLAVIAVSFILPVAGIARNHLGNRTRRCRRMELHVKNGNLRSSGR